MVAPRFSVQRSQNTYFKGFWDLWTENRGAPKMPNPTTTDPEEYAGKKDVFIPLALSVSQCRCMLGAPTASGMKTKPQAEGDREAQPPRRSEEEISNTPCYKNYLRASKSHAIPEDWSSGLKGVFKELRVKTAMFDKMNSVSK